MEVGVEVGVVERLQVCQVQGGVGVGVQVPLAGKVQRQRQRQRLLLLLLLLLGQVVGLGRCGQLPCGLWRGGGCLRLLLLRAGVG